MAARKPRTPIQYEDALVSLIDILGFQSLVDNLTPQRISRILGRLKHTANPYPTDRAKGKGRHEAYLNFSDTTVDAIPLRKKRQRIKGIVVDHLYRLAMVQFGLIAKEQAILRGGVAIGPIVKSWGLLFGPGLNTAHNLEKGGPPRILVDQSVIDEVTSNERHWRYGKDHELEMLMSLLQTDGDAWFLDYLRVCNQELDPYAFEAFLRQHAHFINEGPRKFHDKPSEQTDQRMTVRAKYTWLKVYHEASVSALPFDHEARYGEWPGAIAAAPRAFSGQCAFFS